MEGRRPLFTALMTLLTIAVTAPTFAQEAQWIWSPTVPHERVPVNAACLFSQIV
jgi:hypothetical protein